MRSRRPRHGLAVRLLGSHLLVAIISLSAATIVTGVVGPALFHHHLLMVGREEQSAELFHVEQAYRQANLITLVVALLAALACAIAVTWWLSRRIQVPLEHLTQAATGMAGGDYSVRVPQVSGGTEVDTLAAAFNSMAHRLESTEDTRRRLLSDLAHEMSTPVSVLSVYVEGLQDGVTSWNSATSEVMAEQLGRLIRLVEDIDDVSRAEEGRIDLDYSVVSIADLTHAAATAFHDAYDAKGVILRVESAEATERVSVDRHRMAQVLDNLLSNALRHTPQGGQVSISVLDQDQETVTLAVRDTGEGLTPDQLSHIFERFYRGDTARDREHGGSGIGLTISRALVEAQGGSLNATSQGPGHGCVFTLRLPRYNAR